MNGSAVVDGNTIYISSENNVYSCDRLYKWTKLQPHKYSGFGMVVLIHTLISVGGGIEKQPTNLIHSLIGNSWRETFLPMPTKRMYPAVANITTHLLVAGGLQESALATVEVFHFEASQWFTASSLPLKLRHPQMALSGGCVYFSEGNSIFCCSIEKLYIPCKPVSPHNSSDGESVWTRLADIPVEEYASLATVKGHVLAIGGIDDELDSRPSGAIHCYDAVMNSWSVIGELPTPRYEALTAVLPSNELVVMGGRTSFYHLCRVTDIGHYNATPFTSI